MIVYVHLHPIPIEMPEYVFKGLVNKDEFLQSILSAKIAEARDADKTLIETVVKA